MYTGQEARHAFCLKVIGTHTSQEGVVPESQDLASEASSISGIKDPFPPLNYLKLRFGQAIYQVFKNMFIFPEYN